MKGRQAQKKLTACRAGQAGTLDASISLIKAVSNVFAVFLLPLRHGIVCVFGGADL